MTMAPFDVLADGVGLPVEPAVPRSFHLVSDDGRRHGLDAERWFHPPELEEQEVLDLAVPPAIDVGCGPGRHTIALAGRGLLAIGVDIGPAMVALARRRGADAILGSVFDPLPGGRSWGSALLLDGNIGIGGDPVALLRRVHCLLRPGGRLLVETSPFGEPSRMERVRLDGAGELGQPFDWAMVGADALWSLAAATGFRVIRSWERRGRWFARLDAV
jgi:SAM-dependent methyltransferase